MGKGVNSGAFVRWFSELKKEDAKSVGLKAAFLSELYNKKFPVPAGFVITSRAFKHFIEKNKLADHISHTLKSTDLRNISSLDRNAAHVRKMIENAEMPKDLRDAIIEAYEVLDLGKKSLSNASGDALDILMTGHEPPFVAVRSSSIDEEEDSSFAGQHDALLNVKGQDVLIKNVKKIFASLYTPRAIVYRDKKGFGKEDLSLGVIVQKMIDSDKSGIIYSRNPLGNDSIFIEAAFGLGKGIVEGKISPDSYSVSHDLELIDSEISDKRIALTRNSSGKTDVVNLTNEISKKEVLSGHEIKILAQLAHRIEELFDKPETIEFAIENGSVNVIQTRPISSYSKIDDKEIVGNELLKGKTVSSGVVSGIVKVIEGAEDLDKIKRDSILVCESFSPKIVALMDRACGIIAEKGSASSHGAHVAREIKMPAIVKAHGALKKLQDGQLVTLDGFKGKVIEGEGTERQIDIEAVTETKKTKVKAVVDLSEHVDKIANAGIKEVGLVKLESVSSSSGKHPVWFIKNDKLDEYVSTNYKNLKKISRPFEEIWIRLSKIRTDKYRNLEGAPDTSEKNPALGDQGIRFSLKNQGFLEAEFKIVKDLADEFADKKFGIILPHIISVEELKESKKIFSDIKMPDNVKIGIAVETPAAVQIINDLCEEGVDFVSLGLEDLAQLTLGVDKDNEELKEIYDETNQGVLNSISYVLRRCKRYGVATSVFGSSVNRPKMIQFLVEQGAGSIAVNPENASKVSEIVANWEEQQENKSAGEKTDKNVNEEELVLQALGNGEKENEYSPGSIEKREDVPSLNEAMPVTHQDLEEEKKEEEVEVESMKEEDTVVKNEDHDKLADTQESADNPVDNDLSGDEGASKEDYGNVIGNLFGEEEELNKSSDMDNDTREEETEMAEEEKQEASMEEPSISGVEDIEEGVFEAEVEQEVKNSEEREAAKKEILAQAQGQPGQDQEQEDTEEDSKKGENKVLDIF